MPNDNLAMGYRPRCESEEQLVNDMEEDDYEEEIQEEMEQAEQEELEFQAQEPSHKHVYFVTDPRMSSWSAKDDNPSASTKLGYDCSFCFMNMQSDFLSLLMFFDWISDFFNPTFYWVNIFTC